MKITFKNHERTGRFRSFQKEQSDIKGDGKVIGWIGETEQRDYELWLHKKEEGVRFKNVRLKYRAASMKDAKEWFKKNAAAILKAIPVVQIED